MSSYLKSDGIYDPRRNFAVTNWSDEDFTISWTGEATNDKGLIDGVPIEYTISAGEVKTFPMYLAYYITTNLVDREMYKLAKDKPADSKERERLEMAVANKDLRKPFEDKTIQEVIPGQESPEVVAMRASIRKELIAEGELNGNMSSELNLNPDGTKKEFADVPQKNKGGRPRKEAAKV